MPEGRIKLFKLRRTIRVRRLETRDVYLTNDMRPYKWSAVWEDGKALTVDEARVIRERARQDAYNDENIVYHAIVPSNS